MPERSRIEAYANAMLEVARVEGHLADVEDELFRFARTFEANDELRLALTDAALPVERDFGAFYRDFEWMGLQRHLKVLGIFARIRYRDGKPGYVEDTPRFLRYARAVCERYRELAPLAGLLDRLENPQGAVVENTKR